MKIAENIEALQLRMHFKGEESVIHPVLLWDSEGATLVDTGMPGQLAELRVEIEGAGVGFETIRRVERQGLAKEADRLRYRPCPLLPRRVFRPRRLRENRGAKRGGERALTTNYRVMWYPLVLQTILARRRTKSIGDTSFPCGLRERGVEGKEDTRWRKGELDR
jgi:hypothetical protein